MGLSKSSFSDAFGSKHALFLTASLLGFYIAAQARDGRDALNDIADGALASLA